MTRVEQPGPDTFLGLSDTPLSYFGEAGKVVDVNSGATALQFTTSSSSTAVVEEVTGTVNGVNTVFNLSSTPVSNASVQIEHGGQVMRNGIEVTITGTTVTFAAGSEPLVRPFARYST